MVQSFREWSIYYCNGVTSQLWCSGGKVGIHWPLTLCKRAHNFPRYSPIEGRYPCDHFVHICLNESAMKRVEKYCSKVDRWTCWQFNPISHCQSKKRQSVYDRRLVKVAAGCGRRHPVAKRTSCLLLFHDHDQACTIMMPCGRQGRKTMWDNGTWTTNAENQKLLC